MRYLIFLFTLVLFLGSSLKVRAADSLQTYNLKDSIVVVANRYQTSLKNMAYDYQLLKGTELTQLASHSVLQAVDVETPSAFVMEKKVMGYGLGTEGSGQVNLRGLGGQPNTGVLLLINGHPDFMGIFGHPLPDVYGADDIRQVEVLSGPASTVFGSHAMGGVVNIITRSKYRTPFSFSAEGGSFNSYNVGMSVAKQFTQSGLYLSGRYKYSDGHLERSGFQSFALSGGWNYQLNAHWNVSATGRYVPYSFDDPTRLDSLDVAGLGTYAKIERGTGAVLLQNNFARLKGSFQIYTNMGKHRFYDGFESTDFAYGFSAYQYWNGGGKLQLAGGSDVLFYGGQAENKYATLPNGMPVVKEDRQNYNSVGLYLLGFYDVTSYLNVKGGMRYQHHSTGLDSYAPMASISLQPLSHLRLFAGYKSGFRFPTMQELYLFPSANDRLKQEEVHGFDAGAAYYWQHSALQINWYQNDVKNLIQTVSNPAPPPMFKFENDARQTRMNGLEAQLSVYPLKNISLQFSYAYLNPDELTAFNPKQQIKFVLSGRIDKFSLTLFGKYIEDIYAANNHQQRLPDYLVSNVFASYQMGPVTGHVRLFNIFNRKYYYLPQYEAPPFYMMAGVSYHL